MRPSSLLPIQCSGSGSIFTMGDCILTSIACQVSARCSHTLNFDLNTLWCRPCLPSSRWSNNKTATPFTSACASWCLPQSLSKLPAGDLLDKTKVAQARSQLPLVDCLVAHSGQLLESMGKPPETSVDRICVIVPSARVGGIARGLGYKRVEVAESALPKAMLKSTKDVLQKKELT